ncbi:MAG: DUF6788 family protein [Actinomycetota bacterium]
MAERGGSPVPEPLIIRGTLFEKRRRCGKANCKCAHGEAHISPTLSYQEGRRNVTLVLSQADVEEVAAALARYRAARERLDAAADAGIVALAARIAARRSERRAPR